MTVHEARNYMYAELCSMSVQEPLYLHLGVVQVQLVCCGTVVEWI